jgi:large conductance mechanosensitive channel
MAVASPPEATPPQVLRETRPRVAKRSADLVRGFGDFIRDYGVVPLAVGVVIGSSVNDLVKTLVDGIFTPFISLISPENHLQDFQLHVHGVDFKIGAVANALISFLIVAWIVYLAAKLVLRNESLLKK